MEDRKLCMRCMAQMTDGQEKCSVCGFVESGFITEKHHLPLRTILKGQYLVGCALGEGGFGITYIGWDLFLHIPVAIKEYFPSGVVIRDQGQHTVSVFAGKDEQSFLKGRESFFREAQKVAKFDNHPGVVSVKNCFIENGTAYIIMEYISGINLGLYASKRGGKLGFQETLHLLERPIKTLDVMHNASTYHRDISPENLMLSQSGAVKLIDFGSAMESDSEKKTRVLMVRSGYSPVEMYSNNGKDGPYSDVYSMAATIYKLITGVTPPAATERLDVDTLVKPSMLGVKDITPAQEEALIKGMTVQQKDRYQTMAEFFRDLYGYEIDDEAHKSESKAKSNYRMLTVLAALLGVIILVGIGVLLGRGLNNDSPSPTAEATATPTEIAVDAATEKPVLGTQLRAFLRENGYDAPDDQPIPEEALAKIGAVRMFGSELYFQLLNEDGSLSWNDELGRDWRQEGEDVDEAVQNQSTANTLDLAELTDCVNLQYLNLRDVLVSNVQALGNLQSLNNLILDNCGVTGEILPILSGLTNISQLRLDNNSLTNLDGLQTLENLFDLTVANNRITSAAPLAELSIGNLNLHGNPIKSLSELSGGKLVSAINRLCVSSDTVDFSVLAEMTNLTHFERYGASSEEYTSLDFSGLAAAENIEYVYISNCRVKNLDFASNKPNLTTLELWDCGITSDMLSGIHDLAALDMLNLSYNRITYIDNLALDTMPVLKTLYLNNNYITDFDSLNVSGAYIGGQLDPSELLNDELRAALREHLNLSDGQSVRQEQLDRIYALTVVNGEVIFHTYDGEIDPEADMLEWLVSVERDGDYSIFTLEQLDWGSFSDSDFSEMSDDAFDLNQLKLLRNLRYFHLTNRRAVNSDALTALPLLNRLVMVNCGLTDEDVAAIGQNPSITDLNLARNQITSIQGLEGRGYGYLGLAFNDISDISELAVLDSENTGMWGLDISYNSRLTSLEALPANLKESISSLYIAGLEIDLKPLSEFKSLNTLRLGDGRNGNRISLNLTELSNVTLSNGMWPETLRLVGAQVDSLDFLKPLENLKILMVSNCGVTESMLPALNELTQLEELRLEHDGLNSLDGIEFSDMENLRCLALYGNNIAELPELNEGIEVVGLDNE